MDLTLGVMAALGIGSMEQVFFWPFPRFIVWNLGSTSALERAVGETYRFGAYFLT